MEFLSFFLVVETIVLLALIGMGAAIYRTNRLLVSRNNMLAEMMDAPGTGMIVFNEEKKLTRTNKNALSFIPALIDETAGISDLHGFLDYIFDRSVDVHSHLSPALENSFEGVGERGFFDVIETEDGRICLVEIRKTPLDFHVAVLTDMSGYQRQEEKLFSLSRSKFELEQAVQAMGSGIVLIEGSFEGYGIFYANRSFCEVMKVPADEIAGHSFLEWLEGAVDAQTLKKLLLCFSEGVPAGMEIKVSEKSESGVWYNLKITPVSHGEPKGEIDFFVIVFTDISDLKKQEEAMIKSQKLEALGQLAAGVAHDFNNVLSIVDGYTQIAAKHLEEPEKVQGYLEKITAASKRGAVLTRQMLIFGRRKVVTKDSVVDMVEMIRQQEVLFAPVLGQNIELSLWSEEEILPVECSQDALEQILMNLVLNAVDAMPHRGGRIEIETGIAEEKDIPSDWRDRKKGKKYVYLRVRDNGSGISEDIIGKIFDPFFTTKRQDKGTGLGLSLIYGRVKETGGHIGVWSKVGEGTVFEVFLPMSDKPPDQKREIKRGNGKLSLKGYTAMVVDDEPDIVEIVGDMLRGMDMNVITANNGDEALACQDDYEGYIDLLLTDIVMPGVDGIKMSELFMSLRSETNVVYMSGYPSQESEAGKALSALPSDAVLLVKPFEFKELADIIYRRLCDEAGTGNNEGAAAAAQWQFVDRAG